MNPFELLNNPLPTGGGTALECLTQDATRLRSLSSAACLRHYQHLVSQHRAKTANVDAELERIRTEAASAASRLMALDEPALQPAGSYLDIGRGQNGGIK